MLFRAQQYAALEGVARSILTTDGEKGLKEALNIMGQSADTIEVLEVLIEKLKLTSALKESILSCCHQAIWEKFLKEGKLDQGFEYVKNRLRLPANYLQLLEAALDANRTDIVKNVIGLIELRHGKNLALLDFGVVLLEKNKKDMAARIFATNGLHFTHERIGFFVNRERGMKRPDVLVDLYQICKKNGLADVSDQTTLLSSAHDLYRKAKNNEGTGVVERLALENSSVIEALKFTKHRKLTAKENIKGASST